MSRIQEDVNKAIEQHEFANMIANQQRKDLEEYIETQKNNAENYTTEELDYMNSEYYPTYMNCLNQLGNYAENLYKEIFFIYESNRINYNDAFFMGIKRINSIAGIGFPIPERFVKLIKNTIKDSLNEISKIDDGEFYVNVVPVEYNKTGMNNNIAKPSYSYQIEVELKRKTIENKQK